ARPLRPVARRPAAGRAEGALPGGGARAGLARPAALPDAHRPVPPRREGGAGRVLAGAAGRSLGVAVPLGRGPADDPARRRGGAAGRARGGVAGRARARRGPGPLGPAAAVLARRLGPLP